MSTKKESKLKESARASHIVRPMNGCSVALSRNDPVSGILIFNRAGAGSKAICCWQKIHLPRLARAKYKNSADCPVDQFHRPKSDFAMLMALRTCSGDNDRAAAGWRLTHFRAKRRELEEDGGKVVSANNWEIALRIADCPVKFGEYASQMILSLIQSDQASTQLKRFSKWIDNSYVQDLVAGYIDDKHEKFLRSVEMAADKAGRVPTKKQVRAEYDNLIQENLRSPFEFDSMMELLHFDWLPRGGRGPSAHDLPTSHKTRN